MTCPGMTYRGILGKLYYEYANKVGHLRPIQASQTPWMISLAPADRGVPTERP